MKKKILIGFGILILIIVSIVTILYFVKKSSSQKNQTVIENISNTDLEEKNEVLTELDNEENESIVVELPQKENTHINLSVIGDIMCHNSQYIDAYISSSDTYDFSYAFEDIRDDIATADIAIGNLETTFAGKSRGYSNYPQFNTPEQLAGNLRDFGIDILTTANNHCMDTGYSGLESTLNYLDEAGVAHTGTNRSTDEQNTILIKEVNNIKIAFLSFTYGTNGIVIPSDKIYAVNLINEDFMKEQLELAKSQKPDLICVSMHWGIEYQTHQNETQENLANFLFANGADIILGSHPHVLQPMEKKIITLENGTQKDGFVIYSLGNFMSGQTQKGTRSSIILKLGIDKDGYSGKISISDISYVPIYTYKASSGSHRYRIINMENTIFKYESGIDTSIGQSNYGILKSELDRIRNLLGN